MCFCSQFLLVELGLVTSAHLVAATLALCKIFCFVTQALKLIYTQPVYRPFKCIWSSCKVFQAVNYFLCCCSGRMFATIKKCWVLKCCQRPASQKKSGKKRSLHSHHQCVRCSPSMNIPALHVSCNTHSLFISSVAVDGRVCLLFELQ